MKRIFTLLAFFVVCTAAFSQATVTLECYSCEELSGRYCASCQDSEVNYFKGLLVRTPQGAFEINSPFSVLVRGSSVRLTDWQGDIVAFARRDTPYRNMEELMDVINGCNCEGGGGSLTPGSVGTDELADGAVEWDKLSDAVQDSIQAGGGGGTGFADQNTIIGDGSIGNEFAVNRYINTNPDIFVSPQGDNGYIGLRAHLAKQTLNSGESALSGTGEPKGRLALKQGVYRETLQLPDDRVLTTWDTTGNDVFLPEISGMDRVNSWAPAGVNSFSATVSGSSGSSVNYDYIIVAEIDTLIEPHAPYSARRVMRYVANFDTARVDTVPGTYTFSSLTSPYTVWIHPTNSDSLPLSHYRYEVTTKNTNLTVNTDSVTLDGVIFYGAIDGYGMISGGLGLQIQRCAFGAGSTHHTVIESGYFRSSFFFDDMDDAADNVANVFFHNNTSGSHYSGMLNSIATDVVSVSYSHKSGGGGEVDIDKVEYVGNAVWGRTSYQNSAFSANGDTKVVQCSDNFISGFDRAWAGQPEDTLFFTGNTVIDGKIRAELSGPTNDAYINDNIFHNTYDSIIAGEHLALYTSTGYLTFNHNIVYLETDKGANGAQVNYWADEAVRNFYISGINGDLLINRVDVGGVNGSVVDGSISDYNIFIKTGSGGFNWLIDNDGGGGPTSTSLSDWQTRTGLDQNSLYIDVSGNPAGLLEIFMDPMHGDWRLNPDGDHYSQIVALGVVGPKVKKRLYKIKPSYEEAILLCKSGEGARGLQTNAPDGFNITTVSLSDLGDVSVSSLTDGQVIQWNSTTESWENSNAAAGINPGTEHLVALYNAAGDNLTTDTKFSFNRSLNEGYIGNMIFDADADEILVPGNLILEIKGGTGNGQLKLWGHNQTFFYNDNDNSGEGWIWRNLSEQNVMRLIPNVRTLFLGRAGQANFTVSGGTGANSSGVNLILSGGEGSGNGITNKGGDTYLQSGFSTATASGSGLAAPGGNVYIRTADTTANSYHTRMFFQGGNGVNAGAIGVGTVTPDDAFDIVGDLEVTGAYKDSNGESGTAGELLTSTATGTDWVDPQVAIGDGYYGEYYIIASSPVTLSITAGTPVVISGSSAGNLNGFTHSNGRLTWTGSQTITVLVTFSTSFEFDTSGSTVDFQAYKNGTAIANITALNEFPVALTDVTDALPMSGIVSLSTNDYIEVFVDSTVSGDATIRTCNLSLIKI